MQLREFLKYCEDHNVSEFAQICFENLDYGGFVYADAVDYDPESQTINLKIN